MTWQDYADPKGFRVFDLETRELETVLNPNSIFYKMDYDDSGSSDVTNSSYLDKEFLSNVIGKYV
jgi:hypothetical protein